MKLARTGALVLVVAMLAASCTQSKVDPDAKVTVSGTITDGDDPLAGAVVSLRAEPTAIQVIGGLGLAFSTLGLACALDPGPAICRDDTRRVGSAADGGFRFELTGADTQDAFGTAQTVSITTSGPPRGREISGPATTESSLVQVTDLKLGRFGLWRPELTFGSQPPADATVTWSALPQGFTGTLQGYRVVFDDARGGVVWQQAGGGQASFDARLLEGTTGGVSVLAMTEAPGPHTAERFDYRSPRLPYVNGFEPPPSRGTSCVQQSRTTNGQPAKTLQPCPLTDGDFATINAVRDPMVIDLGRAVSVSLLAVRGCVSSCTVELSTDTTTWTPLTTVNDAFGVVAPNSRPAGRYLRLSATGGAYLTEVSVWEGDPVLPAAAPAALQLAEPGSVARQEPEQLSEGIPTWVWVIILVVVTALLTGAFTFILARRTRKPPQLPYAGSRG